MKDVSLEQYNLFKFGSLTGKKTVAEEVKEVTENVDICKDVEEVKQFLENSNINKTKSIFRELTDEQVEELMRAEEEDFNFVSEANEIAEETITATESKTLTPDNSPMTLEPNKTYNVKLTYGNNTYNYDVTTGATDVQIKYFTTDGALGITGDNVKVKPSSDNEKNNIRFDGSNNKLDLSTAGITNIINNIRYYKTFEGGSSISKDEDTPLAVDLTLTRGDAQQTLTVTNEEKTILLTNPFTGSNYTYKVSFLQENVAAAQADGLPTTGEIKFKFLENGRFVITGNCVKVTAGDNQVDDLIVVGSYNEINTGDLDDTVRAAWVQDANGSYYNVGANTAKAFYTKTEENKGSYIYNETTGKYEYVGSNKGNYKRSLIAVNNKINTGSGDDYVKYSGYNNVIDMGDGDKDRCLASASTYRSKSQISNAQASLYKTSYYQTTEANMDGLDGWARQGTSGNCGLLSLINSMSYCSQTTDLSYFIDVETVEKDKIYNVTFKNATGVTYNTIQVTTSDINKYTEVYGDPDTKLFIYALKKLVLKNNPEYANESDDILSYMFNNKRSQLSQYLFGNTYWAMFLNAKNPDTGTAYGNTITNTQIKNYIRHFLAGDVSNFEISFSNGYGVTSNDHSLGIICGHAYAVRTGDLSHNDDKLDWVELVNPWDDNDCIRLTIETLCNRTVWVQARGYTDAQQRKFMK